MSTTEPDQWSPLPESLQSTSTSSHNSWSIAFPSLQTIYDTQSRLTSPLGDYYRKHILTTLAKLTREEGRQFGALVIEPTCLGAGGMVFVDPLFQACLVEVVRESADLFGNTSSAENDGRNHTQISTSSSQWRGLPVVYDEGIPSHRFIRPI